MGMYLYPSLYSENLAICLVNEKGYELGHPWSETERISLFRLSDLIFVNR